MTTPTYHQDIAGTGYFEELPDNWRLATEKDFYSQGTLLVDVAYLIKNSSDQYEGYRTKARSIHENINEILNFIALGRVYVLER